MRVSRFLRSVCQGLYVNVSLHCLIDDGVERNLTNMKAPVKCLFVCLFV